MKEVAEKFCTISNQAYSHLSKYYRLKGDHAMVAKLEQARALSKVFKAVDEYNEAYCTAVEVWL